MKASKIISAAAIGALTSVASYGQGPLPNIARGNISILLTPIATGMSAPLYGVSPPGDSTRMFVLEQNGLVRVLLNGTLLPTPALNIQARVSPPLVATNANDERGLLGMAIHPGFSDPQSPGFRTLYTYNSELIPVSTTVTYVAPNASVQNYKNVINEWKMTIDPNVIDPASRREIISFGKNAANHNGGTIAFGPDGYLYLGLGDGGNANDVGASHIEPGGNAQNLSTPLGKMLRIDPLNPALTSTSPNSISSNGQYRIPTTNPFQGAGQVREIYAYGLRNPYRFAFDRLSGDLILADVGQNNIEEIDRIVLGGNYGWAIKEGDFLFNRTTGVGGNAGTIGARSPGVPAGLTDPISGPLGTLVYDHDDGISITGGFVYRGSAIPELVGKYVFGDLALRAAPTRVDGRLFYADLSTGVINEFLLPQFAPGILPSGLTVHGFGEDASGELYAMVTNTPSNGTGGIIYRLSSCAITISSPPIAAVACPTGNASFSIGASGGGPLNYSWQVRVATPPTEVWQTLGNDPAPIPCGSVSGGSGTGSAFASPLNASTVNIGITGCQPSGPAFAQRWPIRCIVSNACGSVTSTTATLSVCAADFNCDGQRSIDDIFIYINAWFTNDPRCDVDGNPGLTIDDLFVFINIWFAGC